MSADPARRTSTRVKVGPSCSAVHPYAVPPGRTVDSGDIRVCADDQCTATQAPLAITRGRSVQFGDLPVVEVGVDAGVTLCLRRASESRIPLRDCEGNRWHEDEESLQEWAYRSAHSEAAALHAAAELHFDAWENDRPLGCYWPVVWTEDTACVLLGNPSGRPAKQPYMLFGGAAHDEVQGRDDAIEGSCRHATPSTSETSVSSYRELTAPCSAREIVFIRVSRPVTVPSADYVMVDGHGLRE